MHKKLLVARLPRTVCLGQLTMYPDVSDALTPLRQRENFVITTASSHTSENIYWRHIILNAAPGSHV